MERLLAQTMSAEQSDVAPPTPECLDAERLAAWSDGALSAIEGFDVEQHLSTCTRCQTMLAAYVRITGAEPEAAVVLPFLRRPAVRWIVPIIAAAAAGVIWFVLPRSWSEPVPATQMARVEQQTPGPIAESTPRVSTPSGVADNTTKERDVAATGELRGQPDSAVASKAAGGPVSPTPAAASVESPREVTVTAEVTPVQAASSSRTTALAPPALAARPAMGVVEIVPRSMGVPTAARAQADAASAVQESTVRTRWQIRPNGTVVRILGDAGTPELVTLSAPTPVTAGDAASPFECWLIGAASAMWRSTDGLHFERVTSPVDADLRTIIATSARQATVTTTDGRRFVTTDAGLTWRSLP